MKLCRKKFTLFFPSLITLIVFWTWYLNIYEYKTPNRLEYSDPKINLNHENVSFLQTLDLIIPIIDLRDLHGFNNLLKSILHFEPDHHRSYLNRSICPTPEVANVPISDRKLQINVVLSNSYLYDVTKTLMDSWPVQPDIGIIIKLMHFSNKLLSALAIKSVNASFVHRLISHGISSVNLAKNILLIQPRTMLLTDIFHFEFQIRNLMHSKYTVATNFHACKSIQKIEFFEQYVESECNKFNFLYLKNYNYQLEKNPILFLPKNFNCETKDLEYSSWPNTPILSLEWDAEAAGQRIDEWVEQIRTIISSPPKYLQNFVATTLDDRKKDPCYKFERIAFAKRRTHLSFAGTMPTEIDTNRLDVTLMTVLTLDRMSVFEVIVAMWNGPIIAVIYINDAEVALFSKILQFNMKLNDLKRITYHVVYKIDDYNPINYLRNVALNSSRTSHGLFVDVDLVPSARLYENLLKSLTQTGFSKDELIVVPTFQSFSSLVDGTPKNKTQLLSLIDRNIAVGYGMKNSWNLGHAPTDFKKWKTATKPYQAIFSDAFEPYVVVPRNLTARYNELLLDRMGDKIGYSRLLHALGKKFMVSPDDFLLHLPHPPSTYRLFYTKERDMYRCGSQFFETYRSELYKRYPKVKF